ncbi:peptidoglycan DD-metalloendopeptidase family protein [Streptomyces desertarenae]|uniref:Peptidoglycan DD-metalloendopeptidase family protein n=1 Tax=Streptomyces desertarenae TaxID=2666184 RepID=A0ABW4PLW6_9ACTN
MNDRHPSGDSAPADPAADASYGPYGLPYDQSAYGYQVSQDTSYGYATGTFDALGDAYGGDPLFGPLPGQAQAAPSQGLTGTVTAPDASWDGGTGSYPAYGGYDDHSTGTWAHVPAQPDSPEDTAGGYGWTAADTAHGADPHPDPHTAHGAYPAAGWDDSGAYPTADPAAYGTPASADPDGYGFPDQEFPAQDFSDQGFSTQEFPAQDFSDQAFSTQEFPLPDTEAPGASDPSEEHDASRGSAGSPGPGSSGDGTHDAPHDGSGTSPDPQAGPVHGEGPGGPGLPARSGGSRRRRSARPKRSALLTVAVPSVCVMGVTAVAAASVGDDGDDAPAQAAPDTSAVKINAANSKLDTQLAGLSDEAEGFADRASRTQERIDLRERQEAERKRKAAEAARREALRPKFALPVAQHGLSAYYGQAGINWVSLHTGIDFPVSYGTPVMAATDGTVRTQWHSAYGNMVIVTAPDGTETWYCHLSSARIRSGSVKAGDIIAYSGNSGKSTGPHLHFEVRPGGGAAIDPLSWLRSKGLDPT